MSRARRIAIILMFCLIVKHLLSNEYGVFDRVLEIIIAGVVLAEGIVGLITWLANRKRKRLLAQRTGVLRCAMSNGQELQRSIPASGDSHVADWAQAVNNWGKETRGLLKSFSEHAETAFSLPTPSEPYVTGSEGAVLVEARLFLTSSLNNLLGIIEKPDVYL